MEVGMKENEKGLRVFNFESRQVRIVMIDGEPWFVARDVAGALGYSQASLEVGKVLFGHIPEEWVHLNPIRMNLKDGREQVRDMLCLSEQGVYFFLARSDKSAALPFQRKIAGEIMPSIRKHGAYMTPQKIKEIIQNPDVIISLAQTLKEEQAKTRGLEARIEADYPKVLFADSVATSKTSILIGDFAKILCQNGVPIGPNRFFQWLRDNEYLMSRKGESHNMPTQYSMENEWFEIKERVISSPDGNFRIVKTTKMTGKGQIYFLNLFITKLA